jgi:hypothetical protein
MKRLLAFWPYIVLVISPFAFIALVSCTPETPSSQSVNVSGPYNEDVTAVCIEGVQYWENDRGNFAPKYSPGYHNPDMCK